MRGNSTHLKQTQKCEIKDIDFYQLEIFWCVTVLFSFSNSLVQAWHALLSVEVEVGGSAMYWSSGKEQTNSSQTT